MGVSGWGDRRRGQSAPLGVVLVFGMVIVSTIAVVTLGAGALSSTQTQLATQQTETALTQLDSQAALVALGQSGVQQVDLGSGTGGRYRVTNDAGWMNLSYTNTSSGDTTTVFNETMGTVEYEGTGDRTVAYQGGGVWRSDGTGNALMISPPEFHYREATLTLPLVTVRGGDSLDNRAVVTHSNSTRYFPNQTMDSDFRNPLDDGRVEITVQSQYYRGWGQYFETRTDGNVQYDHPNDEVTLTLVTPLQNTRITSATASLSASGSFSLTGSAKTACSPTVYTNSYNSSGTTDGYCAQTPGDDGDIVYGQNVDISSGTGTSNIRGDIVSGGTVTVSGSMGSGQPDVYGNISYTDTCDPSVGDCEDRILSGSGGQVRQISGVADASSINGVVRTTVTQTRTSNDNGGNISSGTLDFSNAGTTDTVELSSGEYYLTAIAASGDETILLNTTDGDITLAIENGISLQHSGDAPTVKVVGDGTVNVYVNGTDTAPHMKLDKKSEITNDGDDATQLRVYGRDNFTARIGSGAGGSNVAQFVGVIYAPPGPTGTGRVDLDGGVVYGGILTGTTTIDGGSIHYDEALRSERILSRGASVVKVTYIHASVNEVNVSDA